MNSSEELVAEINEYLCLKWKSNEDIEEENIISTVYVQSLNPPIIEKLIDDNF